MFEIKSGDSLTFGHDFETISLNLIMCFIFENITKPLFVSMLTVVGAAIPLGFLIYIFIYIPRKNDYTQILPGLEEGLLKTKEYYKNTKKRLDALLETNGDEFVVIDNTNISDEAKKLILDIIAYMRKSEHDAWRAVYHEEVEIQKYKNYNYFKVIQDLLDRKYFNSKVE